VKDRDLVLKALRSGHMLLLAEVARAAGLNTLVTRDILTSLYKSGEVGFRNEYWWDVPPAERRNVQRVEVDGVS
jgi:hypothetical protein